MVVVAAASPMERAALPAGAGQLYCRCPRCLFMSSRVGGTGKKERRTQRRGGQGGVIAKDGSRGWGALIKTEGATVRHRCGLLAQGAVWILHDRRRRNCFLA